MKKGGCLIAALAAVVVLGLFVMSSYNGLVSADEAVKQQWSNVESAYQRRADLVPNLVASVKGAANFEQETLTRVIEARSKATSIQVGAGAVDDPAKFAQFQQAQDGLSSALSRLLAVVESYPQLQAVQGFRDLMIQLEGTENRINVERNRYNEVAQSFNSKVRRFPIALFAGMMGFKPKEYFKSQAGADTAPKVDFGAAAPAPTR
jgi:LemA protein